MEEWEGCVRELESVDPGWDLRGFVGREHKD
jgi:hypothetical protein